jgi:bifunctional non-homologous end joining protein LigD
MARQSKLPKALQPMLATLVDAPFDDRDWVFESKCDGFRIVAAIEKRSVTLYSRNGLIVSDNYVPIAKALEKVKSDAVIDGELVAIDERRKISMPRSAMIGRTTRCQDIRGLPCRVRPID